LAIAITLPKLFFPSPSLQVYEHLQCFLIDNIFCHKKQEIFKEKNADIKYKNMSFEKSPLGLS